MEQTVTEKRVNANQSHHTGTCSAHREPYVNRAERMGDDIREVDSQDLDHTKPHRLVSPVWKSLQSRDGSVGLAGGAQIITSILEQKKTNSQT